MPRFRLRIALFKVSKKGSVRQVEQAGGVISHDVRLSWDEETDSAVAMQSLVFTSFVAEQRVRSVARDRSFIAPRERRGVVGAVFDGAVGQVEVVSHDAELSLAASLFEVAVCHVAREVVGGHQASFHIFRVFEAPHARLQVFVPEHATHS